MRKIILFIHNWVNVLFLGPKSKFLNMSLNVFSGFFWNCIWLQTLKSGYMWRVGFLRTNDGFLGSTFFNFSQTVSIRFLGICIKKLVKVIDWICKENSQAKHRLNKWVIFWSKVNTFLSIYSLGFSEMYFIVKLVQ